MVEIDPQETLAFHRTGQSNMEKQTLGGWKRHWGGTNAVWHTDYNVDAIASHGSAQQVNAPTPTRHVVRSRKCAAHLR
jgi:hypothetical protein